MDYPSVILTDFEEYDGYYYYNTAYYLRSGNVVVSHSPEGSTIEVNATTYYGTTVHAVWTDISGSTALETTTATPASNGRYNVLGQRVNGNYRGIVIIDGQKKLQ